MEELSSETLGQTPQPNSQPGTSQKAGPPKIIRPKILNLSKHSFTKHQVTLLSRGPKYCPATKGRNSDFSSDNYKLVKRFIIQEKYFDSSWNDDSLINTPSKKYMTLTNKELQDIVATVNKLEPTRKTECANILKNEELALKEIRELTKSSIEIKKANKTNTLVVMNKNEYQEQLVMECHLNTPSYEEVDNDCDRLVFRNLKKLCEKYQNCMTKGEEKAILNNDWKTSRFYNVPKINKSEEILQAVRSTPGEYI